MATFLPQQTTLRPLPDFMPSSPPDQAILNNRAQQTKSTQNATAESIRHRQSADFTANGTAYTNGNGNGNGAMLVPNGPPHHIPNGGSRHRGTMSLGAFDGPRTPPNTKSKALYHYHKCPPTVLITATQIPRMSRANSSDQGSARLGKLVHSHIRPMSRPSIRLVNTLPRYERPCSRSSRLWTDTSARATASLERNAHWYTSFQME